MHKVYITGHTNGIGKTMYEYFFFNGFEVQGFSLSNGYDLNEQINDIVNIVEYNSIFVNNAYASGVQIKLLELLNNKVSKMIVCGSIASEYADTEKLQYSIDKKLLKEKVYKFGINNKETRYLLLNLTSSSYADAELITNSIKFWLDNQDIIEIGYNLDE